MSKLTSTLVVRLLDQVPEPAKKAATSILGIQRAADGSGKVAPLGARIGQAIERNNQALAVTQGQLFGAIAGFYALKRAIGGPVVIAAEFEASMNRVAAVSGASEEELKMLAAQARQLGRDTQFTASQAADAQNFLAMAGFKTNAILGAMPGTLQLAASAQMDMGSAADIVTNILTGYGKSVEELGHVNDVLVKAFTSANTDLRQLSEAMKYAGPVASAAGVQFEETAAALSLMGNAGIQSTMAGTSLRGAISRILSPTKAVREVMKETGLSFTDANGKLLPLANIVERLGPHADDAGLFMQLFGQRAGPAMAALVSQGADALRKLTHELENSEGTAQRIAETQMRGTKGLFLQLKSAFEDMQISLGNSLAPVLNSIQATLVPVLNSLSQFISDNPRLVAAIVGTAAALVALKVTLIGVRYAALLARGGLLSAALPFARLGGWASTAATSAIGLQTALAGMSGAKLTGWQKFTTGLMGIARAVPGLGLAQAALVAIGGALSAPVIGAIAAVAIGGAAIYKYWDRISSFFSGVASAIGEELAPALEAIRPALDWLAPIGEVIAAGWQTAKAALSGFMEWIGSFFAREILDEEAKAGFEKAGHDAAKRMIDAIKKAFGGLFDWMSGLGSRIGSAIGGAASRAVGAVRGVFGGSGGDGIEPRAMGGPVRHGRTYLVGEHGPELWRAPSSGRIVPHDRTMDILRTAQSGSSSSKGGGVVNNVMVRAPITISGSANPERTAKEVSEALAEKIGLALRGVHADIGVA